ncbi:MAG: 3-hydroxyacyl-ACP dehydratase FabZ family protein [Planctomycetota bacterium]
MIPEPIFQTDSYDVLRPIFSKEQIRKHNAQRYEMEMLDGVLHYDKEKRVIVGYYEMTPDRWWAKGHFPDRPMMPGVLALESAGQLCSIYFNEYSQGLRMGLAKIGEVRYVRPMEPPDTLFILGRLVNKKLKFANFEFQGIINHQVVFYGEFTGGAI